MRKLAIAVCTLTVLLSLSACGNGVRRRVIDDNSGYIIQDPTDATKASRGEYIEIIEHFANVQEETASKAADYVTAGAEESLGLRDYGDGSQWGIMNLIRHFLQIN